VKALDLRKKLDIATNSRIVFVGYGDRFSVKAYRLYDPTQRRFHFAHSVYFDETSLINPPVKALDLRKKLDATSSRMVFVGYSDRFSVKAYRLYDLTQRRFHFAHSVYFNETSLISP
jgi:hypothetical protein